MFLSRNPMANPVVRRFVEPSSQGRLSSSSSSDDEVEAVLRGRQRQGRLNVSGSGISRGSEDVPDNEGPELPCENPTVKDFVISPYFYVMRFSRALKRAEVLGFGFVSVVLMCIILNAQIGLEAEGFHYPVLGQWHQDEGWINSYSLDSKFSAESHLQHSFSWVALSDFFLSDSVTPAERDCLHMTKSNRRFASKHRKGLQEKLTKKNKDDPEEDILETMYERVSNYFVFGEESEEFLKANLARNGSHRWICGKPRIADGWSWFTRYLLGQWLSIANLCCTVVLLLFIRCRRRKGFQFALMLPAFLAVFIGLFQQIPMLYTYSYTGLYLLDMMKEATYRSFPPIVIAPIWEETQYHGKCCGIKSPDTWAFPGADKFPLSCCNRERYSCEGFHINRTEVWPRGCYDQEYEKVKFYEFYAMIIWFVKMVCEMGVLWCLSDLSRYDYPRPENQHNSTCEIGDFEVKTKGAAKIVGVTEQRQMVIKLVKYRPNKYIFRSNQIGALNHINIRTLDGESGSIEIRRARRNRNVESAEVDFESGKSKGLLFLTF